MGRPTVDLTNVRFGRLTAVKRGHSKKNGAAWLCLCDCGKHTVVYSTRLRNGDTQSCGCYQRHQLSLRKKTHGKSQTITYQAWLNMKARCYNQKIPAYKNYGGRGIAVCDRWLNSFENFYSDMGEMTVGLTIERIDNDKGYSPKNCKWATRVEQARNMRSTRMIRYGGKNQSLSAWAEEIGINYRTLIDRLRRHPPQIAFNM